MGRPQQIFVRLTWIFFIWLLGALPSLATAATAKCTMVRLVANRPALCVLWTVTGYKRLAELSVVDHRRRILATQCFETWHGMARMRRIDLLGDGSEQLAVEFEGNGGTGQRQMLMAVMRFDGKALKPILVEVSSVLYGRGVDDEYKVGVSTRLIRRSGGRSTVLLAYKSSIETNGKTTKRFRTWSEELRWHPGSGWLYDAAMEAELVRSGDSKFRRELAKVRLAIMKLSASELCEKMQQTGLYEITAPGEIYN